MILYKLHICKHRQAFSTFFYLLSWIFKKYDVLVDYFSSQSIIKNIIGIIILVVESPQI